MLFTGLPTNLSFDAAAQLEKRLPVRPVLSWCYGFANDRYYDEVVDSLLAPRFGERYLYCAWLDARAQLKAAHPDRY